MTSPISQSISMGAFVALIIPLLLIQFGLMIYCIVRAAKMKMNPTAKAIWILIILFFSLVGSIVFLIVAKPEEDKSEGT